MTATEPRLPFLSRGPLLLGGACLLAVACAGVLLRRAEPAPLPPGEEVVLAPAPMPSAPSASVPARLVPRVHAQLPHDPGAFTQGLLVEGSRTFESTGLVGRSSLREVERATGRVLRSVDVAAPRFAEGLALVGQELVQLTWQDHVAYVYGRDDFALHREHRYDTEGWGLCYDGTTLYMSDGSDVLFARDPSTFAVRAQLPVRAEGEPVERLNELECVGEHVYANVWQTNRIVRIRKADGVVDAIVDAAALEPRTPGVDVLNGIAYLPETERFLLTGKLWPVMYEVSFEAAP